MSKKNVASPCLAYERMSGRWVLIHDLLGGTATMRRAGNRWLHKEEAEEEPLYYARLNRSILFEALGETIEELVSRPFAHGIIIVGLPEDLIYLVSDVDGTGKSFDMLAKEILRDLITYGVAHIFVDYSISDLAATKAEEKESGVRVFLSRISPPELIGWQTEERGKDIVIKQIRISETKTVSDGEYNDKEELYIRVINEDTWELHVKRQEKWIQESFGSHSFGSIPLVSTYDNMEGMLEAKPPLEPLAWLNLAHWQSSSDQRHILRLSRFGIIFGKGFSKKDIAEGVIIGPAKAIFTPAAEADMKYVEPTGKAMESGLADLEDLEMKMAKMGLRPYEKNMKQSTATGKKVDESRNISKLQAWIRDVERLLTSALQKACEWRSIEPPEDLNVDIYSDFDVSIFGSGDEEFLLKATAAGKLSTSSFLTETKRRGTVSESMDVDEEVEAIKREAAEELNGVVEDED